MRALDSLARKFDRDLAEIRSLADEQRLGDLFVPAPIIIDIALPSPSLMTVPLVRRGPHLRRCYPLK